jgi:hypothetical protein
VSDLPLPPHPAVKPQATALFDRADWISIERLPTPVLEKLRSLVHHATDLAILAQDYCHASVYRNTIDDLDGELQFRVHLAQNPDQLTAEIARLVPPSLN